MTLRKVVRSYLALMTLREVVRSYLALMTLMEVVRSYLAIMTLRKPETVLKHLKLVAIFIYISID
jgi:hypothetical protein